MISAWMLAVFAILSWKAGGASVLARSMLGVLKTSNLIRFSPFTFSSASDVRRFHPLNRQRLHTIKEAQSYMSVLTIIMMVPLLTMTFIQKILTAVSRAYFPDSPLHAFTMHERALPTPLFDLIGNDGFCCLAPLPSPSGWPAKSSASASFAQASPESRRN